MIRLMINPDHIKDYDILIRRLTIIALSLDPVNKINKDFLNKKLVEIYGYNTKFDVDEKTIDRDIKYIEKNYGLTFEKVRVKDYRFTSLNDEDKLSEAIKLFSYLIIQSKEVDNSFKLLAKAGTGVLLNLMYINAAIKNNQTIEITYNVKYLEVKTYKIEVEPYEIVFNYGTWYLIGFSLYNKEFRQYILQNIKAVKIIKDKTGEDKIFNRRNDFSLQDFYSTSIKSFKQECDRKTFKVWFSSKVLNDIDLLYGLKDLQIEKQKDESIIATFTADGYKELIDWIWQFGSYAQILSPKEAINEIRDRIKELKKLY